MVYVICSVSGGGYVDLEELLAGFCVFLAVGWLLVEGGLVEGEFDFVFWFEVEVDG